MAKRKLHHLHKIKVHHNRWLIWAISYAVIVAIALVGYVKISDLNLETESQSVFEAWHSYKDPKLGFGLRYPANWSMEADSATSINFLPSELSDSGVSVSVVPSSLETSIRRSLKIVKESPVTLDNITATKITNDLGNAHSETVILGKNDNQLYVIRGSENQVRKIIETFYFLTK